MKILVSADACNPYGGSEAHVGWSVVECMARHHDLWVLTSGRHHSDIERAATEGMIPPNVTFEYPNWPKPWRSTAMMCKLQSWTDYYKFTRNALNFGQKLHQSVRFDLVHHVTTATWRIGSPLWKLGIPFVWGPIGGAEQVPLKLYSILSPSAKGFELVRMFSNCLSRYSPAVRSCARHAAYIAASTNEAKRLLVKLRGTEAGVSVLSQAFFSPSKIESFSAAASGRQFSGPLRFFGGGKLEGLKGFALALAALARLKQQGMQFSYYIGGIGPEADHLAQLTERLGLRENVVFGYWSGKDYMDQLVASHVLLLPSLRDTAGLTMMEAMLAGCVPVVADSGGPGHIVTDACGCKVPIGNAAAMIDGLAAAIAVLDKDRSLLQRKSVEATNRIKTAFSEDAYFQAMNVIYQRVTGRQKVSDGQPLWAA